MNLTNKEREYLGAIANSDFGDVLGDEVWTDCLEHTLGTGAGGVAASLVTKGLIRVSTRGVTSQLTDAGVQVVLELGLCKHAGRVAYATRGVV